MYDRKAVWRRMTKTQRERSLSGFRKCHKDPKWRRAVSLATKEHWKDPAYRDYMLKSLHSSKSAAKRSQALQDETFREEHSKRMTRYYAEHPEKRKAISDSVKAWVGTPAGRKHMSDMAYAGVKKRGWRVREKLPTLPKTVEPIPVIHQLTPVGCKISKALKAYYRKPGSRRKQSERIKKFFRLHPEAGRRHSRRMKMKYRKDNIFRLRWSASQRRKPNYSEMWMARLLKELGLRFRSQFAIGPYFPDFRLLDFPVLIEVDGFWHYTKSGATKDKKRERLFLSRGFFVLRVPSYDYEADKQPVVDNLLAVLAVSRSKAKPSVVRVNVRKHHVDDRAIPWEGSAQQAIKRLKSLHKS